MTQLSHPLPQPVAAGVPAQPAPWTPRGSVELLADQLAALDAWNRARRDSEQEIAASSGNREAALDARRRADALRRETDALRQRSDQALRASGSLLVAVPRPRALLVHRQSWLADKVAAALQAAGVTVLGVLDDGAEAVGWAVAEQPDLVLVEQMLPTLTGREVVRRVRAFSPRTVVAAQVPYEVDVQAMLDAGAHLALPRRVPPADMATALAERVRIS